jgi:hypothetical protein
MSTNVGGAPHAHEATHRPLPGHSPATPRAAPPTRRADHDLPVMIGAIS